MLNASNETFFERGQVSEGGLVGVADTRAAYQWYALARFANHRSESIPRLESLKAVLSKAERKKALDQAAKTYAAVYADQDSAKKWIRKQLEEWE